MSSHSSTIEIQELVKMAEADKEQWQKRSIYKLPIWVKKKHLTAYTPQVVSLGPYHRNDKNLKPMDIHKDRAVNRFLKRSGLNYDDCVQSLSGIVRELMDAYDCLDDEYQHQERKFLDLMIRDGIFILEIIDYKEKKVLGYAHNDPIFSDHGYLNVLHLITRDMIKLENQIPMKALQKLYRLRPEATEEDATKVIFRFMFPDKTISTPPSNSLHMLDMYRTGIIIGQPPYRTGIIGKPFKKIRSAVELNEAGIEFVRSKTRNLDDITFRFQDGVLELPELEVNESTETVFHNLLAFERFHCGMGNNVKEYVCFMDSIIDNALDIKLLNSRDIIQNLIGSDEEAAKLFNSLAKDICLYQGDNLYEHVSHSVNAYCKRRIPRYRAALYHNYLTSPWSIISVFAAILLFVLTITQTYYSIFGFL